MTELPGFTGLKREAQECHWCGGMAALDTVCPLSIGCATCQALPGSPCKRPSGHRAAELHVARIRQAKGMGA